MKWHTELGTVSGKGNDGEEKEILPEISGELAVQRMRRCENVGELARELGVRPRCLYKWRAKLEALEPGDEAARPSTHAALFLTGTMAHGLFAREPPAPKPSLATDPASKAEKSEAEPQAEVSVQDTTSVFKLRVILVQVHVVVRGDGDKPVDSLHKEDFQLYDNGKLQTISTFAIENDRSRKERTEAALKTQVNNGSAILQNYAGSVSWSTRRTPRSPNLLLNPQKAHFKK